MKTKVCMSILIAACGIGQAMAATIADPARNQSASELNRELQQELALVALTARQESGGRASAPDKRNSEEQKKLIIKAIEAEPSGDRGLEWLAAFGGGGSFDRERAWLGLNTEEAPDVLSSQMGLEAGVGLVVTYVATNSPAAKAGLQKNDVLVEFEGQALSVPAQLRRLVQARKEGDKVKLMYYRGGKKHTTTATLEQAKAGGPMNWDRLELDKSINELRRQLQEGPFRETMRERAQDLRKALENLKIDQGKLKNEIEKSVKEAMGALENAMREATNARHGLDPAHRALRELQRSEVFLDKSPSVVVRSSSNQVKSVVKSDDSGTLVIVANPEPRLTAHDKDGKLLFDGPISTQEQKDKVPPELWQRVEPLLDQVQKTAEEEEK